MISTISAWSIVIFVTLLNISYWFVVFTFFQNLQKLQNLHMKLAVPAQFNHSNKFWFNYSVWTSLPSTDSLSTEPRGPVWAGGSMCWGSRPLRRWSNRNSSCMGSAPLRTGWGRHPVWLSISRRGPGARKGRRSGISQPVKTVYMWCFVSCGTNEEAFLRLVSKDFGGPWQEVPGLLPHKNHLLPGLFSSFHWISLNQHLALPHTDWKHVLFLLKLFFSR